MAVTDVLLVIGFLAGGLSMWFSFNKKENTNPKEIQSDEEEYKKSIVEYTELEASGSNF